MNRRNILNLSAITVLALTLMSGSALAQQKSVKEQLVGSWSFVSVETTRADGSKFQSFGPNPQGLTIFDANGRYSSLVLRPDRAKFTSNNRMEGTPEENKATAQGTLASYGKYTVDEATRTIIFQIERSSYPNWDGTEQKRSFTLNGDDLTYSVPAPSTGSGTSKVVLKRAK